MSSQAQKRRKTVLAGGGDVHSHTATFSLAEITGNYTETPIVTFVDRVSTDNRCFYREEVAVAPPSPVKRHRAGQSEPAPNLPEPDVDDTTSRYQMGFDLEDFGMDPPPPDPKPTARSKPSDSALARFRGLRDSYLGNLLRRNGCIWRSGAEHCACCEASTIESNVYRCKSCYGDRLLCSDCMVATHSHNPLHRIEHWNGRFIESSSLHALGLRVQLGHPLGSHCSVPLQLHDNFTVLHTNGIHRVAVNACDCEQQLWAGPPEEQLLRAGWFPATNERPRTCATLEVLDQFLALTYQAKTMMYNYYSVLEKLTNNTGIKPPNRYQAFLRMVREYAHLLMLKRAGRGHAMSGAMGTGQGELAVRCPCCPWPGVNLPEDWQDAPPEFRFLYIMFLAMDTCFRLKRRLVSSYIKDPSLAKGLAYMVASDMFREYLLTVTDQKEMSTCSGLAALDYANTKYSRGYAATGVGMVVCARHKFVLPNGFESVVLSLGCNRYANMDWVIACVLKHIDGRLRKIISYDIVCQWWRYLKKRLLELPAAVRYHLVLKLVRFVIPKMHIKGHLIGCQDEFSLDRTPGSAQTDGEAIERPWAHIGGVGTSTREMGPGSREDTLNGHWGSWNWQKLVGLGERLRTRLDCANKEYAEQLAAFTQFSAEQADRIGVWKKMVEDYEADPSEKNPYSLPVRGISEAQVLLQFKAEETARVQAGVPSIHSVSPASFVAAGLEVEDEQRRVRVQVQLKKAGTTAQQIDVMALRRGLNHSIQRLRNLQATYTPIAIVVLGQHENVPEDEQPENVPLFLPSALNQAQRSLESVAGLAAIEEMLRDAQCSTALGRLRNQLHVKSQLLTYKALQARHQGANMCSRTLVARNESKIRLHSEKYQMAWEAKLRLEDIRCMEDAEELAQDADKRKAQAERRRQRH
ncbi:hypothetical protein B0H14DRAFT_3496700 [Mycena olivaceomarginata]|nr:hypothetical protein B0H14DRAFT_3496700 [Mycena olivaceomarginata]